MDSSPGHCSPREKAGRCAGMCVGMRTGMCAGRCASMCAGVSMSMSRSILQECAPATNQSCVMAVQSLPSVGGDPLGALIMGLAVSAFGVRWAVLLPVLGVALTIISVLATHSIWRLRSGGR